MPVDIDIEHVARLARLRLTEEESHRLREELGVILEAAAKVREVAADDVAATAYAIPRSNVLRDDVVEPSLPASEALANAPDREGDRFRVPRIVEPRIGEPRIDEPRIDDPRIDEPRIDEME